MNLRTIGWPLKYVDPSVAPENPGLKERETDTPGRQRDWTQYAQRFQQKRRATTKRKRGGGKSDYRVAMLYYPK